MKDNNIGLSLLKSGEWPNHLADKGKHNFVYSMLPHNQPLLQSDIYEEGHKLNAFKYACVLKEQLEIKPDYSFIDIDAENVIIQALKRSEADPKAFVLRLQEERGCSAAVKVTLNNRLLGISRVEQCNSLEDTDYESVGEVRTEYSFSAEDGTLLVEVTPFKFISFLLY